MKVILCALNSQYIHFSPAPYCLAAGLKEYGEDGICCEIVEGTVNEDISALARKITEKKPHLVGLSCYIWNIEKVCLLAREIKKTCACIIVFGGPEVSYNAASVLNAHPEVDYILSGEGERPFALLANAVKNNCSIEGLPGLCYRTDDGVFEAQPYIENGDPPSYISDYAAALNGRIAYIETSRGCPFSCAFCLSGRCGKARSFNIDRAKQDIESLAKSGTKTIKFVDRTFNADKARAKEIICFIIQNLSESGVCFHFEVAGDILDEETLLLLSSAPKGLFQLEIGLQSFNEKTLSYINRKTNLCALTKNIKALLLSQNVHIHIDLIAGLPYEDYASFTESFNTAYELFPHMLQFGFLKLLHGSPMREQAGKFPCSFSQNPPYEVVSTPWLSCEDIEKLHKAEYALDKLYNSCRFSNTLAYLLKANGFTPYELFYTFGSCYTKKSPSLDELTAALYEAFGGGDELRDMLVIDRLTTNASGKLPSVLKRYDSHLKALRALHPPLPGITRGYAILYAQKLFVYVDYINKDLVTGKFQLHSEPL